MSLAALGVGVRIADAVLVTDADLVLVPGTLTAVVGPNGAGKSTLLSVLCGDRSPTTGTATLHGRTVRDHPAADLARRRAVLPQDHAVRFAFSVAEVVAMGRAPHPPNPDLDQTVVRAAMTTAEVGHLATRDVQSLSGGEMARTALARVLTQDTPVVLLDEPTAALDLRHQEQLMGVTRDLARAGACVVVVVHDLNLAASYADRIVMMADGAIVADGTPDEVLTAKRISDVYGQPVQVLRHPTRDRPLVVAV